MAEGSSRNCKISVTGALVCSVLFWRGRWRAALETAPYSTAASAHWMHWKQKKLPAPGTAGALKEAEGFSSTGDFRPLGLAGAALCISRTAVMRHELKKGAAHKLMHTGGCRHSS